MVFLQGRESMMINDCKGKQNRLSLFYKHRIIFRSSHQRCSIKKGVLRNFTKFTGKHLCQSLFFNKTFSTLLKKRLWHRCFPVSFLKFLRTPLLQNTSGRLLLKLITVFNLSISFRS